MVAEGTSAYNPDTGQTAIFTNGKWVVQGAQQMPVPETDTKAIGDLQTQAQEAQWLAQKAQQFRQLQAGGSGASSVQTGPFFHDVGIPHVADNINPIPMIANALDHRVGEMESVSNQAWAHMRPTGSGSLKAPEIEGFQQAFPNIGNWGGTNNGITDRLQQDAETAASKLQFIDNFIRSGQGSYADANASWMQNNRPSPAMPPPPMQMVPNAASPIGVSPAPGVAPPPSSQQTPQQAAILNWTPEKGLHP